MQKTREPLPRARQFHDLDPLFVDALEAVLSDEELGILGRRRWEMAHDTSWMVCRDRFLQRVMMATTVAMLKMI
jgi:hypothetical protein